MRPTNKRFEPEGKSAVESRPIRQFTKGRFMVPPEQVEYEAPPVPTGTDSGTERAERASKWEMRATHVPAPPGRAPEHDDETGITVDLTAEEEEEPETYWQRHSAALPRLSDVED